jgi:soluble lytic murein transglycosylase
MKFTQILTLVCALTATTLWNTSALGQTALKNKGDDTLLDMHQAFRKGDKNRMSAL